MVKRVFQLVVLFFAIYAFVFVPLGRKTALEHVRAIAGTPAAQQAATELQGGVKRLVSELREDAQRSTEATDEKLAASEEPAEPAERARSVAPKARPAELGSGDSSGSGSSKARKVLERFWRSPGGASPQPNLSNLDHPPDLKELRSPPSSRPAR